MNLFQLLIVSSCAIPYFYNFVKITTIRCYLRKSEIAPGRCQQVPLNQSPRTAAVSPNMFSALSDDSMDMNSDLNSGKLYCFLQKRLSVERSLLSSLCSRIVATSMTLIIFFVPSVTPMLTPLLGIKVIIPTVKKFSLLI